MGKNPDKRPQSATVPAVIIYAARILNFFSPAILTRFAARLFTTPIKHKTPKRELEMERNSICKTMHINAIDKQVVVYRYGSANRKILLVHGWSGRGTQLVKIADALLNEGYSTVSFDAPAHGKSSGKTTLMPEFVATILQIQKEMGPFEAAVGHSLGGMSLLNAVTKGLSINRLVTVGSGDVIKDIFDDFITKLQIDIKYSDLLRIYFEKKTGESMADYSAYISAQKITIPVFVIHDTDDNEVPVSAAYNIYANLRNSRLELTSGLGHRKILGDTKITEKIVSFIKEADYENEVVVNNGSVVADGMPESK